MIVQKWIIFPDPVPESTVRWWLSRNKDAVGYISGLPPALAGIAAAENWTLPRIWEETVEAA